jgi:hypothetical protein
VRRGAKTHGKAKLRQTACQTGPAHLSNYYAYKLPPIPTNPTWLPPASQPAPPAPCLPNRAARPPPSQPSPAAPSSPPRRWLPPLPPRVGGSLLSLPLSPAPTPRRSDAWWWPPPQARRKIWRQWRPDGVPGSARRPPLPDHGATQDSASPPPGGPHAVALRSRSPVPFPPGIYQRFNVRKWASQGHQFVAYLAW